MEINNKSFPFNPKSDRIFSSHIINPKKDNNKKFTVRNLNLRKNPVFSTKNQNKNKIRFPKLSPLYSSKSTTNFKIDFHKNKRKITQIINDKNISYLEDIPDHKKELSIHFFQNNDVELVRNLNPDSSNDLIHNLLFKEQLKNNLESKINFFNYLNKNKKSNSEDDEKNEEAKNKLKNEKYGQIKDEFEKKVLKIKQNNLIEKELNNKLRDIKQSYIIKKQDKNKINNKFKQMLNEIDNIGYDIHFFNYKSKNNSLRKSQILDASLNTTNNKQNKSISFNTKESSDRKSIKGAYAERRISDVQNFFKNQKIKDNDRYQKQKRISELKNEINELKIPLNLLNNEINELKDMEKSTKDKLMKYYLELLYYGKEIRSEGLVWIIKGIWKIGENVPMSFMPTFLDLDSIKYLFNLAKFSIELEMSHKRIDDIKASLKEKVNKINMKKINITNTHSKNKEEEKTKINNNETNNKNHLKIKLKKTDKNEKELIKKKNNNSFLFKMNKIFKKKLINSSNGPNFIKSFLNPENNSSIDDNEDKKEKKIRSAVFEFSKILNQNENNFNFSNMPEFIEIKNLRKKIQLLNEQIEELKSKEIKRIFIEYTYNDYEKIYHAPIDIVLGALIGEHSRDIELSNYNSFRKGYLDDLKIIRFYENRKRRKCL